MKRLLSMVAAVGALVLLAPASAHGQEVLAVEIARSATLVDGGQAVLVTATVTCPSGGEVLEAFLYVVQGKQQNTSDFAGLPVTCDGVARTVTVRASAFDLPFHTGKATASAFVLLTNDVSVSPTARLQIRR